jgi:hypothetical protein
MRSDKGKRRRGASQTLSRMFLMFFARVVPASTMANPACMTVRVCAVVCVRWEVLEREVKSWPGS